MFLICEQVVEHREPSPSIVEYSYKHIEQCQILASNKIGTNRQNLLVFGSENRPIESLGVLVKSKYAFFFNQKLFLKLLLARLLLA